MALVDEIKDEASLRAWLETQPREVAVDIAHRAAMRMLPHYWIWVVRRGKMAALPVLRANLVSGTARFVAIPLITAAAAAALRSNVKASAPTNAATDGAVAASGAAGAAAKTAIRTADAAAAAADAASRAAAAADASFWAAVRTDAELTEASDDPLTAPLWNKAENPLDRAWQYVLDQLPAKDAGWDFWRRWYQGALDGKPLDQELLTEIATQDEDFWDGTDDEVNARIAEIVASGEWGGLHSLPLETDIEPAKLDTQITAAEELKAELQSQLDAGEQSLARLKSANSQATNAQTAADTFSENVISAKQARS